MSFLAVGLDLGVQSVKLVVLSPERKLIFRDSQPVRGNFFSALETIIRRNLALLSGQKILISATGAGRNSLDFPAETFKVNEISALAAGIGLVFPGAGSAFDIGAESSRWLELGKLPPGTSSRRWLISPSMKDVPPGPDSSWNSRPTACGCR